MASEDEQDGQDVMNAAFNNENPGIALGISENCFEDEDDESQKDEGALPDAFEEDVAMEIMARKAMCLICGQTTGPMPQQPKFKDCVWESAKHPSMTFCTWLCIFGRIVANYNVGPQLERFLDLFLVRDPQAATTQTRRAGGS